MKSLNLSRFRIEIILFILLWGTYAYFYQASQHNENARFDQVRSILERKELNIDHFAYNTADLIRYPGNQKLYPNKAPGTVFIGLPSFYLSTLVMKMFSFPEWIKYHFICHITTIFSLNLFGAICGLCIYWFILRISRNIFLSLFVTIAYTLGTIAFPFATVYFSHQLAASLVFISFYTIFAINNDFDKNGRFTKYDFLRMIAGGLCGGFAFVTEYPTGIAIFFIQGYAFFTMLIKRRLYKQWGLQCLFFFIGVAPLFWYNIKAFDKIWYVPYSAYAQEGQTSFQEHKKGFVGVQMPWQNKKFFSQFQEVTYKPFRGLFYCNPVLWLIFPGFLAGGIWTARRRKYYSELIMCFLIFISFMIFNANYGETALFWGGGYSIGPRHIVPMLPFLSLPLFFFAVDKYRKGFSETVMAVFIIIAFLLFSKNYHYAPLFKIGKTNIGAWHLMGLLPFLSIPLYFFGREFWFRRFFYLLMMVSVFFSLAATAVEVRAPFEYPDPVFQLHIPFFLQAKLAICNTGVFTSNFLTENSVAFNVGKILRFNPLCQLFPLYIFWSVCAFYLFRAVSEKIREYDLITGQEQAVLEEELELIKRGQNNVSDAAVSEPPANDESETQPESEEKSPREIEIENMIAKIERHDKFNPKAALITVVIYIIILALAPMIYTYHKNLKFKKGTGLVGKYYASPDCTGEVKIIQKDPIIDFDWGVAPPLPGTFSVLWEGDITVTKDGFYEFFTESDDASWLWINGNQIVSNPGEHSRKLAGGGITLPAGKHKIKIQFANYRFGAYMKILWKPPAEHMQAIPPDVLNSPVTKLPENR